MGQPITVAAKPSSNPRVLRFEINRSLTGMGHERYRSADDVVAERPVDELARRVFAHGGVDALHVNSNIITVELAGGSRGDGLQEVIERLFRFYPDAPEGVDTAAATTLTEEEATPESAADPATVTEETIDDAPEPSGPVSGPSGQALPGTPTGHSSAEETATETGA
jgi:hypothetical protein